MRKDLTSIASRLANNDLLLHMLEHVGMVSDEKRSFHVD